MELATFAGFQERKTEMLDINEVHLRLPGDLVHQPRSFAVYGLQITILVALILAGGQERHKGKWSMRLHRINEIGLLRSRTG